MYEHPNYSGKSIVFEEGSIIRLRNTDVGKNRIFSFPNQCLLQFPVGRRWVR